MTSKTLITVVGPTAIGKTALAIKLAQHFSTEIISADSRQFYKEMTIGTAVPSADELRAAPHHFIQNLSIEENYNVGDFERDAIDLLKSLFEIHDVLILIGGSGLYVDAVTKGLDSFPKVDKSIREDLNDTLSSKGIEYLQELLKVHDPKYFETVDLENPHRLIRALEVSIGSGKPYSSFLKDSAKMRPFQTIYIGLEAPRDIIYDRINRRVDIMIAEGLVPEAKQLLGNKENNALNTVGYKELFKFFEKEWSLEFAISEIKKNTRRFAKRQLTWFKRNEDIHWFDFREPIENILSTIHKKMHKPND